MHTDMYKSMHTHTHKHKCTHIHTHKHIHTYAESRIYKAFIQSFSTYILYVQYICIYSISIYNFFTADTPRTDSGFPDKESGCRPWNIMLNLLPTKLLSSAHKTTIMFNIMPITNTIMPQLIST